MVSSNLVSITSPSLFLRNPLDLSGLGSGAPISFPIPIVKTLTPASRASFAASRARPDWSSPSVIRIIAFDYFSSVRKALMDFLKASPNAVPWTGMRSVSMALRKMRAAE